MNWAKGNTRERWEQRFAGEEWVDVEGSLLTETFARCIVAALPDWITNEINQHNKTVLDWGCALGEGVGVFREAWPRADVYGEDFSALAVARAIERFGSVFIHHPDGEIGGNPNVLITSNVLEHIVDYMGLMKRQMTQVLDFYILLVPFEENLGSERAERATPQQRADAGDTHVHKFTVESFPDEVVDDDGHRWGMRVRKPDIVPGPVWPGNQILVVYER